MKKTNFTKMILCLFFPLQGIVAWGQSPTAQSKPTSQSLAIDKAFLDRDYWFLIDAERNSEFAYYFAWAFAVNFDSDVNPFPGENVDDKSLRESFRIGLSYEVREHTFVSLYATQHFYQYDENDFLDSGELSVSPGISYRYVPLVSANENAHPAWYLDFYTGYNFFQIREDIYGGELANRSEWVASLKSSHLFLNGHIKADWGLASLYCLESDPDHLCHHQYLGFTNVLVAFNERFAIRGSYQARLSDVDTGYYEGEDWSHLLRLRGIWNLHRGESSIMNVNIFGEYNYYDSEMDHKNTRAGASLSYELFF